MMQMYIGLHVECPLFLSHFRKILTYQISGKSVQWEPSCCMRTDRWTDVTKLIVAFRNFASVPNKLEDKMKLPSMW